MSLPLTELLSCDQSADEGQHASPGKQRHDEFPAVVGRQETLTCQVETNSKDAAPDREKILLGKNMVRKTDVLN